MRAANVHPKTHWNPIKAVLHLLYPPKCLLCHDIVHEGSQICTKCRELLDCSLLTVPFEVNDRLICASAFYYQEPLRDAFLRYKFEGMDVYAPVFGRYMARAAMCQLGGSFDLITWAPVSKKRRSERGYDQSQLLAAQVAEAYRLSPVPTLKKTRHNKAQSSLGAADRAKNVQGIYSLVPGADVAGRRILLIDDILTTGNTLSACAAVLSEAGADEVVCLTLARHAD